MSRHASQAISPPTEYAAEHLLPTLSKGLVEMCRLRPEDPVEWLGKWLLENKPPPVLVNANEKMQSAFVFVKPHANTPAVREMVLAKFAEQGIEVLTEGSIDGRTIDEQKLIDQHYYAIASKATIMTASALAVPAEKFVESFGEEWEMVKSEGRCFNALEMCQHAKIDAAELFKRWKAAEAAKKLVKFGGGFYCAALETAGQPTQYVFNAFFMSMRAKFTAPSAAITYWVVQFDPARLPWGAFRGKVLGPTDPAKAAADSLRGMLAARWESLGLTAAPNTTDNGVHASASPFEGLAERMNWLQSPIAADAFGKRLLGAGLSEETIRAWAVDPRVPLPGGGTGSLFDALEDLDLEECIGKAIEIGAVSP